MLRRLIAAGRPLLEGTQHPLGRDRKLGDPDADRVVHGGCDRGRLRIVRHLADALRPVRSVRGGVLDQHRLDLGHVLHAGREVRAELSPAMLGVRVVRVAGLEHAEPESHHRPALDLPLNERRVDRAADVEALYEPEHGHLAGLVVHLDLRRTGRVRDRGVGREVDLPGPGVDDRRVGFELGAGAGDELAVPERRRARDVCDRHLLLRRALRDHVTVDDLEVGGVDLHLLGRHVEDLLPHLLGRLQHRVPGDERRARGEGSRAHGGRVGIRVVEGDPVERDADRLGDDLRLDRLRAVSDVGRPREDVHAPVGLDLDPGLRGIAVLVHPGRVLDCSRAAASVLGHD